MCASVAESAYVCQCAGIVLKCALDSELVDEKVGSGNKTSEILDYFSRSLIDIDLPYKA